MKKQSKLITRCAWTAWAVGALCCSGVAFAANPSPAGQVEKKGGAAQLDDKDKEFMMEAAKGGMMEVHMGQMAEKQGQSADVKKIGKTMATDHTNANNQLMAIASKKGVKLDSKMEKMEKMEGSNFDQEYLDAMVKDHEKDIAAFEREAKSGMDPDVKAFASKTLPTLKKHLAMVKSAQSKTAKKSG